MASLRLDEIVARLGGELIGDGSRAVSRIATLEAAGPDDIAFLAQPKYRSQLARTRAAAVIVGPRDAAACPVACIVDPQPYVYFARLAQWLNPRQRAAAGCQAGVVTASQLPPSVAVGAGTVIGADCRIGEGVEIGPNCVIGDGVEIGADSLLHAQVTLYRGCVVGARAVIHSGVVIGADGFGFARERQPAAIAGVETPESANERGEGEEQLKEAMHCWWLTA